MAELASVDHLFNAPSSSVHRIQEAKTTIHNVSWELTLAALCRPGWRDDRQLAGEPVIMASFSDMTRVPGSIGRPLVLGVLPAAAGYVPGSMSAM